MSRHIVTIEMNRMTDMSAVHVAHNGAGQAITERAVQYIYNGSDTRTIVNKCVESCVFELYEQRPNVFRTLGVV
jgi:hypothetical protein